MASTKWQISWRCVRGFGLSLCVMMLCACQSTFRGTVAQRPDSSARYLMVKTHRPAHPTARTESALFRLQQRRWQYQKAAASYGVGVRTVGDNITITIPAEKLFFGETPRIKPAMHQALNLVAVYIRTFPTVAIAVNAYGGRGHDVSSSLALTRQQAENVAARLQRQGLDTRVLTARGFGLCQQHAGARVDIQFQQMVDKPAEDYF